MADSAKHWNDKFRVEIQKESDRAVAIIAAALLEQALESLLRNYFVPCATQDDPLFDGAYAPLANLSSKVDLAHRVGLISARWCRDLHLIRKIRNAFAHNVGGCTFDDASVRTRVLELARSQKMVEHASGTRDNWPAGPKGDFGMTVSWMLWLLWSEAERVTQVATPPDWLPSMPEPPAETGAVEPQESSARSER